MSLRVHRILVRAALDRALYEAMGGFVMNVLWPNPFSLRAGAS